MLLKNKKEKEYTLAINAVGLRQRVNKSRRVSYVFHALYNKVIKKYSFLA